jgi:hypothetical protein
VLAAAHTVAAAAVIAAALVSETDALADVGLCVAKAEAALPGAGTGAALDLAAVAASEFANAIAIAAPLTKEASVTEPGALAHAADAAVTVTIVEDMAR